MFCLKFKLIQNNCIHSNKSFQTSTTVNLFSVSEVVPPLRQNCPIWAVERKWREEVWISWWPGLLPFPVDSLHGSDNRHILCSTTLKSTPASLTHKKPSEPSFPSSLCGWQWGSTFRRRWSASDTPWLQRHPSPPTVSMTSLPPLRLLSTLERNKSGMWFCQLVVP